MQKNIKLDEAQSLAIQSLREYLQLIEKWVSPSFRLFGGKGRVKVQAYGYKPKYNEETGEQTGFELVTAPFWCRNTLGSGQVLDKSRVVRDCVATWSCYAETEKDATGKTHIKSLRWADMPKIESIICEDGVLNPTGEASYEVYQREQGLIKDEDLETPESADTTEAAV